MYIIRKDKHSYDYQGHRKKYISQKFVDACVKISTILLRIMYTFWWPKIVKTECKGFRFFSQWIKNSTLKLGILITTVYKELSFFLLIDKSNY